MNPQDVVAFWRAAGPDRWFEADEAFDRICRERLGAACARASHGVLAAWEASANGALALVVLLDQIPRNIFRGSPKAWATDTIALATAARAIENGFDHVVESDLRQFLYLPFMHAEDLATQDRSVRLYEAHGDVNNLKFAGHHREIVARFGRFPHRNAILGRDSTAEELAFLETDPFRG